MSDMDATMARVADIVGTLRGISGGAVRTASSSTVSSSTASTAATAAATATATSPTAAAASAASFAAALDGATASAGARDALAVGGTTGAATGLTTGPTAGPTTGATTGPTTGATKGPTTGATTGATTAGPDGDAVVADAKRYLGVPYRWGGTDPSTGLDCSGLTQRVFADLGMKLPRTVAQQVHAGQAVSSMDQARPGDLLVFGTHHIGIYIGDGKMLHAPHTGDVVKVAKVYQTPSAIRRVVGDGASGSTGSSGSSVAAASTAYARPVVLRGSGSTSYDGLFDAATSKYDLPSGLLKSVARAESSFNPKAHSAAGAIGLMQLMPGTARELGVDPSDPAQAVDGAARLLRSHLDRFGSVRLAVAAYNAGAGAVSRYHDVPPYAETRTYVQRVLAGIGTVAA